MTDNSKLSTGNADSTGNKLALSKPLPPDLLLIAFIHGFKGNDTTFSAFPERLKHVLSETITSVVVESIVFPAYETKGELNEAVERFADWLRTLTGQREEAHRLEGGGSGKAKVVLCSHSMGGLLAADTLLSIANVRPDKDAPLWPKIIACIAFDTPYLGLSPYIFKNSANKAVEYASAARNVATGLMGGFAAFGANKASGPAKSKQQPQAPAPAATAWGKWGSSIAMGSAALLATAAAGTAYYKRDDITLGYSWATDHMKYVGNLWDEKALEDRVKKLIAMEQDHGVVFRTFYTALPTSPPEHLTPRTFVVLPSKNLLSGEALSRFIPARNAVAEDELQAHTGMFGGATNDGYYELGLATATIIRDAVLIGRGIVEDDTQEAHQRGASEAAMEENIPEEGSAVEKAIVVE